MNNIWFFYIRFMKSFSFFLIMFLLSVQMQAQEGRRFYVKGGTRPKAVFKFEDIYLYPSFISGKVYFKDGGLGGGMMNYNRFAGEMDFIQGLDTLALDVAQKPVK